LGNAQCTRNHLTIGTGLLKGDNKERKERSRRRHSEQGGSKTLIQESLTKDVIIKRGSVGGGGTEMKGGGEKTIIQKGELQGKGAHERSEAGV